MQKRVFLSSILSVMVLVTSSCSSTHSAVSDTHDQADTFETYNRAMFKFNYQVDKYVLKPLAEGYRAITNQYARDRISSVIANLKEPLYATNNLLQGEFTDSGMSLARFAVNSTLGLAGIYDVAEGWGWPRKKAGFDSTLAKWCIKDGPYIILPILGPSTPRAAVSLALDSAFNPLYWATYNDANVKDKVMYSYAAVSGIVTRESVMDIWDDLERNSVDFYAAMRSAYLQNRGQSGCYNDENTQGTAAYDFDFGIEDEDMTYQDMENN